MTFETAVEFILEHEGGYSNDSADAGGETNFGISRRSYPDLDIKNLTQVKAMAIYRKDFWDRCRCGELPHGLDLLVFDACVNQGVVPAIRMLQQSLSMTQDGIVGPMTLRAANRIDIRAEYIARRCHQYALIPQVLRYGLGWFRRVAQASQLAFKESSSVS